MENKLNTKQNLTVWKRFILILLISILMFTCGYYSAYEKASRIAQNDAQARFDEVCYKEDIYEINYGEELFKEKEQNFSTGSFS